MRIAIDAMGGDNAPSEIVKGAVLASKEVTDQIILVGKQPIVQAELDKYHGEYNPEQITIYNADDVILNEDSPVKAVRRKTESSMVKLIDLVRDGQADAALSAGNTGALMTASILHLGKIEGVERPAIVSALPNLGKQGSFSVLLDSGANAECKPSHLLSFAHMGSIYTKCAFGIENPSVGLINIGTEETKGTTMLKETHQLLKNSGLNFYGNVESRDIPAGLVDILVCDGFTGNIVLKLTEGVAWAILKDIKAMVNENLMNKLGGALLKNSMQAMKAQFDYANYGGAPILGVNGLVFKIHGSSNSKAVHRAIVKASVIVEDDMLGQIKAAMAAMPKIEENDAE